MNTMSYLGPRPDELIRSSRVFNLGLFNVRISSNLEVFHAYDYLVEAADESLPVAFDLVCVDIDRDVVDLESISRAADTTMRARRMRAGYYNAHHFGAPAYIVTEPTRTLVFGSNLERLVWPFFIKWFLTRFAVEHGYGHVKAAAVANTHGAVTLILGRGGGGKTVFLTESCKAGASFVTNTHALLTGGTVFGVPSKMRVRKDVAPRSAASNTSSEHIEADSALLDAVDLFPRRLSHGPIANIAVVNYTGLHKERVERLAPEILKTFAHQFALAISTYGLRHDLFAASGYDLHRYATDYDAQVEHMLATFSGVPSFEIDADLFDVEVRDRILLKLGLQETV